jgi:hypothetical protein
MRVIHDYGLVRVVSLGDPFKHSCDIQVQCQRDGEWHLYQGFDSLSDDSAYTNAQEAAGRAIRERAAEIAGAYDRE